MKTRQPKRSIMMYVRMYFTLHISNQNNFLDQKQNSRVDFYGEDYYVVAP